MNEPWYLLYGGSSVDGRGPGKYLGRTIDVFVAARHYIEISKSPYSTGYVEVITDNEHMRYSSINGYRSAILALKEAINQLEES